MYDFDTIIPRQGSSCIKFDRRPELDPYWVADMDFASCPAIIEALRQRIDHGIFGYPQAHPELLDAIENYLATRRNYTVKREEIIHLGGLVPALSIAARAFCAPGDAVMTCTPVYPPFLNVHHDAKAQLITVDHVCVDGVWTFDWEAMEAAVTPTTKVFFLSNPQNPLGRVFTSAEITQLAEFCVRHHMILVSDEIHCDMIFDEDKTPHFSALNLPEELRNQSITLLAPSKTWNIAGLTYAFAVIPNDSVRRRFNQGKGHTHPEINALGFHSAEAAYRHGEPWRKELMAYLKENQRVMTEFLEKHCPTLRLHRAESLYLAWIDASGMQQPNAAQFFEEKAGLFLSDGAFFGWSDHFRFNYGCPRERMLAGLGKIAEALR